MTNKDYAKLNELKEKLLLIQGEKTLFKNILKEDKIESLEIEINKINKEIEAINKKKGNANKNLNRYKKNQYYRKYKPFKNYKFTHGHAPFSEVIKDNGKKMIKQHFERSKNKKWLKNRSNRTIRRAPIIMDICLINGKQDDLLMNDINNCLRPEPFKIIGNHARKMFDCIYYY